MKFTNLLIIGLILLIVKLFYEELNNEITLVKSSLDDREYLVRNLPDKDKAANHIALIRDRLVRLVNYFRDDDRYTEDFRIKRLIENFKDDVLGESPANSKHTSYSVNKGEQIFFCLRQSDQNNKLTDLNTVTFVALHELAHVMTKSIGHTEEFWNNFKFLLKHAINIGIYKYQPFHLKPVKYCGTMISDTPYKLRRTAPP